MSRSIPDAIDAFIRHGQSRGWQPITVETVTMRLGVVARLLAKRGCQRLADLTPADLDAVMADLRTQQRPLGVRVSMARQIRQFTRWLVERGCILSDPARALPVPHDGDAELPPSPLAAAELQAVFAALPRRTVPDLRNVCVLELLYGAALRIAEALALHVDDVDLTARTVTVRDGKGGQDRVVPLMGTAAAAVRDWLAVRRSCLRGPDTGGLFLTAHGKPVRHHVIHQWLGAINHARGPEARHLHPHLFRHSIAVHLLQGGADIRHIQAFLGHANLDTTKIYLRLVPGRLAEDYAKAMPDIAVGPT